MNTDSPARNTDHPRRLRMRLLFAAPMLAFVMLLCWSLASPAGSSPDDDFHLPSIWCGLGERASLCEAGVEPEARVIPYGVVHASDCFARDSSESAACQGDDVARTSAIETERVNTNGLYPPVFYAVMSIFASEDVVASTVIMRAVNALVFVGLSAILYWLLPAKRRPTLVWSLLLSIVPLGIFLVASSNPSSWAIISAGTLWLSLLGFFESSGKRRAALAVLAVVSTAIGAGARADAALYSGLAIVVAIVLSAKATRRFWLSSILPAALAVLSAALYVSASQGGSAAQGLREGTASGAILFLNLLNVPELWVGIFGVWSLGWFDTPLPAIVWVAGLSAAAAVAFIGLSSMSSRKGLAMMGVLATLWALPTYLLVQSGQLVGVDVQPRYLLPLMTIFIGLAALRVNASETLTLTRLQSALVAGALSVANAVALHFNIRRYVSGLDVTSWNLDRGVEWWWSIALSPMAIWAIGTLAFTAVAWILVSEIAGRQGPGRHGQPDPD